MVLCQPSHSQNDKYRTFITSEGLFPSREGPGIAFSLIIGSHVEHINTESAPFLGHQQLSQSPPPIRKYCMRRLRPKFTRSTAPRMGKWINSEGSQDGHGWQRLGCRGTPKLAPKHAEMGPAMATVQCVPPYQQDRIHQTCPTTPLLLSPFRVRP